VTEIAEDAFDMCSDLESIQLPPKLKIISRATFGGCTSLLKVEMGTSIEKIDEYAFANCYSLERVNLENTRITVLNSNVFSYTRLRNVVLPDTLRVIETDHLPAAGIFTPSPSARTYCFSARCVCRMRQAAKIIFTKGVPKSMGKDLFRAKGESRDRKYFLSGYYESLGRKSLIPRSITPPNTPINGHQTVKPSGTATRFNS
jgi:hypothetical protein